MDREDTCRPAVRDRVRAERKAELERTLGLREALAIGIGTMLGAGIFIFPGPAAREAGLVATASFAIDTVVALLLALTTSELATVMPRSGGRMSR